MDDDISPFIGQKRADILRGVKEFMDRGKQEGARGMICVMIAFGDAAESHLSFRSASGALCMSEVAEFGTLALGEIVAHLKRAPLADDILPRQWEVRMSTLLMDASLARQAVRHFGLDAQLQILQEELAEAIVAISHLRRGRCGSREDLVDAIGDVLVMIDQLRTEPFMADELDASVALKCERLRALLPAEPVSGEDPA